MQTLAGHTKEKVLAKKLGYEPTTLAKRRKRAQRTGEPLVPPFITLNRTIYYVDEGTAEWLKGLQQNPLQRARR
jgi:hypothetical protein